MKKSLDWSAIIEIAIGVAMGATLVAILYVMFGGWLANESSKITGLPTTPTK